jgi:hypothetical protein
MIYVPILFQIQVTLRVMVNLGAVPILGLGTGFFPFDLPHFL